MFKAIGMTPRQTITMATCWVAGTGLIAGALAVPLGIELDRHVLPIMASAADLALPASFLSVYADWETAGLALAGIVIAILGALARPTGPLPSRRQPHCAERPTLIGMHDRALAAAPIIQICAQRGSCHHAPVGVQNGARAVYAAHAWLHHAVPHRCR